MLCASCVYTRILWPTSNVEKDVIGESLMPPLVAMTFNILPANSVQTFHCKCWVRSSVSSDLGAKSREYFGFTCFTRSMQVCRLPTARLFAMSTTSVLLTGHNRLC